MVLLPCAWTPAVPVLLMMAFVGGMLKRAGTEPPQLHFLLEKAIITGLVPDASRTWGHGMDKWSSDTAGSMGAALAAGLSFFCSIGCASATHLSTARFFSDAIS